MERVIRIGVLAALAAGCGTGRTSQWQAAAPTPAAATTAPKSAPAGTPEPQADAAEAAWARRGDRAALDQLIAGLEASNATQPNAASLARLARAYHFLADAFLRKEPEPYLAALEKGTAAGERALATASPAFRAKVTADEKVEEAIKVVGPEGLEAMYWYAVNLGKWSRAKGLAALLGNKDRVRGVMERALALDQTFFYGAPHRYFGAYWSLVPVGKDLDKSRTHFERSLGIAPGYVGTKVLMAESYAVKKQDRALFTKLLDEVAATPDGVIPGLEPETRVEKQKATELKAKADDLF